MSSRLALLRRRLYALWTVSATPTTRDTAADRELAMKALIHAVRIRPERAQVIVDKLGLEAVRLMPLPWRTQFVEAIERAPSIGARNLARELRSQLMEPAEEAGDGVER